MYNLQQFGPPQQFGGAGGPDMNMTGTWTKIHPQYPGPDTVFVRDSIMDGNDMIVITDQGNMSMTDFANHYIKESDEEYNMDGTIKTTSAPKQTPTAPKSNSNSDLDYDLLFSGMGEDPNQIPTAYTAPTSTYIPQDVVTPQSTAQIEVKTPASSTIEKVFSKLTSEPKLNVNIIWRDIPITEIEMLEKYFDVSMDDIAKYIKDKYFTDENIVTAISDTLSNIIQK